MQAWRPNNYTRIDGNDYYVSQRTPQGYIMELWGTVVPTDNLDNFATGCKFLHTDGAAGTAIYINEGTTANCDFNPGGSLGSISADDVVLTSALEGFTGQTEADSALAELYQHILTAQAHISIPLASLREVSTMNVGNIAANGGLLASDTTPILSAINGATDGCQRVTWASSNNDVVMFQVALPPDLNDASDLLLYTRIASGGTTNAVGFTVSSWFDEGDTAVSDTSATNQTTTYENALTTIGAADVPASPVTLTIGLTPVAHTTDTLNLTGIWLAYQRKLLGS